MQHFRHAKEQEETASTKTQIYLQNLRSTASFDIGPTEGSSRTNSTANAVSFGMVKRQEMWPPSQLAVHGLEESLQMWCFNPRKSFNSGGGFGKTASSRQNIPASLPDAVALTFPAF